MANEEAAGMLRSIYASHTPLLKDGAADPDARDRVAAGFGALAAIVRDFDPELVIQFSPDHYNGFFYDLMPAFCIGAAARSVGDYRTFEGALPVPEAEARSLADSVLADGIDAAVSYRMVLDHGFVQIWDEMFGRADVYPIIPIFVNCAAPPISTYKRARLLGEAVGRWAASSGKRALIVGSGGLSHDPPFPDIRTASPEIRERLVAGHNPTAEQRAAHETRVLAAGAAAMRGEGPCQPLNPGWDHEVIGTFLRNETRAFDTFDVDEVRRVGGRGGNELLVWVAAHAAHAVASTPEAKLHCYERMDGWIAGMAIMSAS
jgi:2,3-dihydroxyphenylpropionate 1,2-dioxygenase